jgi:DNA modification methylase
MYKSVWDFGRAGKANYSVHAMGEYPSKIRPIVFSYIVKRFSNREDTILDPFCGCGTLAVEAKIHRRNSINYDINPYAVKLTKMKLDALDKNEIRRLTREFITEYKKEYKKVETKFEKVRIQKEINKLRDRLKKLEENPDYCNTTHLVEVKDARKLDLGDESVDSVITDIPYASMIKYSDQPEDLSLIEDYDTFLKEIKKAFSEIWRVLKKDKYCIIFCADYRIGASRKILPVHADVINIMRELGFTFFDIYIWRYYRSGGFRPFGKRPYQAMNLHIYILVFHKPDGGELNKPNRPVRYRPRLKEKLEKSRNSELTIQDFIK